MRAADGPARGAAAAMAALTCAMLLSQFFRGCLAVVAPELQHDLGLTPAGFGTLSSCFFLSFAVAQLPVGVAFDRYGVGRPATLLLAVGIAGGVLFALAPHGPAAMLAQAALGVACAPIFMGLIHYASESLPADRFTRAVGTSNGLGMLGGLAAAAPLGWAATHFGWRPPMLVAAACMAAVCWAVHRTVRDTGHAEARAESPAAVLRSCIGLLRLRPLWTLIPLCLAMAAGTAFRNAWGGPYLHGVFGLDTLQRGAAITLLTLAALAASFLLPALARRWTLKATVQRWSGLSLVAALLLAALPGLWLPFDLAVLALLATVGTLHPLVMSHGREMLVPRLRGRGLGLLNSFVFLGSALASWGFGWIAEAGTQRGWAADTTFGLVFLAAAAALALSLWPYARSPQSQDGVEAPGGDTGA